MQLALSVRTVEPARSLFPPSILMKRTRVSTKAALLILLTFPSTTPEAPRPRILIANTRLRLSLLQI